MLQLACQRAVVTRCTRLGERCERIHFNVRASDLQSFTMLSERCECANITVYATMSCSQYTILSDHYECVKFMLQLPSFTMVTER